MKEKETVCVIVGWTWIKTVYIQPGVSLALNSLFSSANSYHTYGFDGPVLHDSAETR